MAVVTYLVVPDLHVPFHDEAFVQLTYKVIEQVRKSGGKLAGLVQLGDALDCWQISDYDKDPQRRERLSDDVGQYQNILDHWRMLMPRGAVIHQLEGNHEDRLRRYHVRNAPATIEFVPSWSDVLELPRRNAVWHPLLKWRSCTIGDTVFHHGKFFDKHLAANNLVRYPCNFVQGHAHRYQYACDGNKVSITLGHGSDEDKTMHSETPCVWTKAMLLYHLDAQGRGGFEPLFPNRNQLVMRGKVLEV